MKIVVFGQFNAGKSTFIQAIDPQSRHVDVDSTEGKTTVAIDYGRADIFGKKVYLFGTPGQERFEFVRDITELGMDAAILVVDSTCEIDEFTKTLYSHLKNTEVPVMIVMNKCDLVESRPLLERDNFQNAKIYQVSALNPLSARKALEMFIESIPEREEIR